MKKGLKSLLSAAVVAGVSGLAANAAEATNPAVEAKAVPVFAQNLSQSSVIPTGPAMKIEAGLSPGMPGQ